MLLLSARAGRLAQRIGPRLPMSAGPLLAAVGLALLAPVGADANYFTDVLPGVLVFSLGLSLTVAPLTATVLAAAPPEHAGVASAVNNDVARVAGLLAVAVLPVAAGISGADALDPDVFADGFRVAMLLAAALCALGGLIAFATIRRPGEVSAGVRRHQEPVSSCSVSGPPMRQFRVGADR
jgi:MFS family permease